MRHESWMEKDERTPEEIDRERLRFLEHEPNAVMVKAGNEYDCAPLAADVWRDMIDPALKPVL